MKKFLVFSVFFIVIAACSDGTAAQAPDQHASPTPSPPPVAQDYDSSRDPDLEGRDVDLNGIRDDVQFWLDREVPPDSPFLQDYLRVAKLLQDVLLERGDYVKSYAELIGMGDCIIHSASEKEQNALQSVQMLHRLNHRTFNTLKRIDHYFLVDAELSLQRVLLSEDEIIALCQQQ